MDSFKDALNRTITPIPNFSCHLIYLSEQVECSKDDPNICITCFPYSRFITGESIDDYGSSGHAICFTLWILTFLVGVFGTVTNLLIILILRRQKDNGSFNTLLLGLAGFDCICSVTAVLTSTSSMAFMQNWNRSGPTFWGFYVGLLTVLFSRSGSSFMTVVISIERYLVVAFPLKFKNSIKRSKYLVGCVITWAVLMGIARGCSFWVGENYIGRNFESLKHLDTMIKIHDIGLFNFWFITLDSFFDQIDFWAPLPLLLLFNAMIYYYVLQFESRRKVLNPKHQKDVYAARMFLPVVVILLLCNIGPIVHYAFFYKGLLYGEMFHVMCFSFVVNSAVNLPIYYLKGSSFRKETKTLLAEYFSFVGPYSSSGMNADSIDVRSA